MELLEQNRNNVTELKTDVAKYIDRFIRNQANRSEQTANLYYNDIKNFFQMTRKKNIETLSKEDLKFTLEEMEDWYYHLLKKEKLAASTVNRYLTSVKMCMLDLRKRGCIDDISFLDIDTVSHNPASHGILTFDEIEEALQLVLKQGKKEVGLIKHYLIKFSVDTCARLAECLKLKWKNFQVLGDEVRIFVIGKGNKEFNSIITREFYDELRSNLKTGDSEYVFNIHRNTVNDMMSQLRQSMNIPKERNIVFHSFRKSGVDRIWKITRDQNQARKAANHSSARTTELYIDMEEDSGVRGYFSSKYKVDNNLYKEVEQSQLVKAIEQLDKGLQQQINLKLREMSNE